MIVKLAVVHKLRNDFFTIKYNRDKKWVKIIPHYQGNNKGIPEEYSIYTP